MTWRLYLLTVENKKRAPISKSALDFVLLLSDKKIKAIKN